jgi:hypothetical protein
MLANAANCGNAELHEEVGASPDIRPHYPAATACASPAGIAQVLLRDRTKEENDDPVRGEDRS